MNDHGSSGSISAGWRTAVSMEVWEPALDNPGARVIGNAGAVRGYPQFSTPESQFSMRRNKKAEQICPASVIDLQLSACLFSVFRACLLAPSALLPYPKASLSASSCLLCLMFTIIRTTRATTNIIVESAKRLGLMPILTSL